MKLFKKFLFICLVSLISASSFAAQTNTNIVAISPLGFTNNLRQALDPSQFNTNAWPITITNLGSVPTTVTNLHSISNIITYHIIGNGGTLQNLVVGPGAGGSATITFNGGDGSGNDLSFYVSVTTGGTAPTVNSIFTVDFATVYTNAPTVVFSALNDNAAANMINIYASNAVNRVGLFSRVALTNSLTYKWGFHILGGSQ